ncbi:patatin-like phospholipase family protein [Actinomadura latina]|uniref:Patatin-like phospholipase family protein n=1 Tax=Actinomadura latina TaxID=163603 RepID=A0A846YQ74_9ACTN|nr:patatin-like phospholipase family protein [Actinomadura latina]NKZ02930.1 patatin-like phospholipase family protein [Actinomadura latina]
MDGCADLVLEGGGVKGIALVGAIAEMEARGYRFGAPARIAGTSAGAIVGSMLAAGMPVSDMVRVMREVDYRSFQDGSRFAVVRGISLLATLGMHRGDALHRWIAARLRDCGVETFGQLRLDDPGSALPPEHAYKLVVVVSDVSSGRMVCLPWEYERYGLDADDQPVADAVRASASIPVFFRPCRICRKDGRKCVQVDGGMLSNYPITIFDREDREPRWPTFGVKLSGRPPSGGVFRQWRGIRGPVGYGRALVSTMAEAHDRVQMDEPSIVARTMFARTGGVLATDFDLDAQTRDRLYAAGREAAARFLDGWDHGDYLARHRCHRPV